ncbi:FkbM family methyltransferase [Thiohalorhabdus denitrificans]|uniref:Methyltransferase, FkbM family n=1 Tax=Thiohalorhabdus denitrificans TaxID=381306 RepID=A0A1G5AN16_9GAMM|nr:FkbM family methyltransferase [Thiohalorhabdus denitrificans]SCX79220.1 methyltransferase, FkbM family [Thiohalorhabdus denitrificans]
MGARKMLDKLFFRFTRNKNLINQSIYKVCLSYIKAYENVNYDYRVNGEKYLIKILKEFSPQTVFDVGANRGEWTRMAKEFLPIAEVHAFEVVSGTFARLNENLKDQQGVYLNNFGLSAKTGNSRIFMDAEKDTHSTMITNELGREYFHLEEVQTKRGEEYCAENGIEFIDLLKVDVEGAENLVLDGFSDMLDEGRISVIQFEYTPLNIYSRFLLKDFYGLLSAKGYSVGKLYPYGVAFKKYTPSDEDFKGPNYVAVHESRPETIKRLQLPN